MIQIFPSLSCIIFRIFGEDKLKSLLYLYAIWWPNKVVKLLSYCSQMKSFLVISCSRGTIPISFAEVLRWSLSWGIFFLCWFKKFVYYMQFMWQDGRIRCVWFPGPNGDLRVYLEGLALATTSVQEYVMNHPFRNWQKGPDFKRQKVQRQWLKGISLFSYSLCQIFSLLNIRCLSTFHDNFQVNVVLDYSGEVSCDEEMSTSVRASWSE